MTANNDLLPALRALLGEWRKDAEMRSFNAEGFRKLGMDTSADHYDSCISQLAVCIRDLEQFIKDGEK